MSPPHLLSNAELLKVIGDIVQRHFARLVRCEDNVEGVGLVGNDVRYDLIEVREELGTKKGRRKGELIN